MTYNKFCNKICGDIYDDWLTVNTIKPKTTHTEKEVTGICCGNTTYKFVPKIPEIREVIFNNPATIVYWEDRSKTVVMCDGETFDKEKGLAMAILKKLNDNKGNYNDIFRKWCGD